MNNKPNICMAIFLIALPHITGCTTCANAVPNDEPTMAEIYEQAMQASNCSTLEKARQQVKSQVAYMNKASEKLNNTSKTSALFPKLPNPQLILYVYPHLSQPDEAPVPGYTTAFNLYEREHYAVDEEIELTYFKN